MRAVREIATAESGIDQALAADGDGDGDVLSAGQDVRWYESSGDGPLEFSRRAVPYAREGTVAAIAAADLDDDGDVEVATAESDGSGLRYENDGFEFPRFTVRALDFGVVGSSVVAADLDGDGAIDLAVADEDLGAILWYRNLGHGRYERDTVGMGGDGAAALAVADVDGDGRLDLAVVSQHDDTLTWYRNTGSTPLVFTRAVVTRTAGGAVRVAVGDSNGDAQMDLITAERDDREVGWYAARRSLVLGRTPLVQGETAMSTTEGAAPGETVTFLASPTGAGEGVCHPALELCLDLLAPVRLLGTAPVRKECTAALTRILPSDPGTPAELSTQAIVARPAE